MPVEPSGNTLQVNGIDLFYETRGQGEPLLLLHGGSGCHEDWAYAGRDLFAAEYRLILPDARGHGSSTNPARVITHRQCALDMLGLLDHLGIQRCKAVGISMGGNILLHMATMQPDLLAAMVVVSPAMYFPEQARAVMRTISPETPPPDQWERMRKSHRHGADQIKAIWEWSRGMADSYDDMNFTPPLLANITASTLVVYGDRDFLYPVEMGVHLYRAIPKSALWIVPKGNHGPVFLDAATRFAQTALNFLKP